MFDSDMQHNYLINYQVVI